MAIAAGEGAGDAGRGAMDVTGVVKKPSASPRPGRGAAAADRGRSGYDTTGVAAKRIGGLLVVVVVGIALVSFLPASKMTVDEKGKKTKGRFRGLTARGLDREQRGRGGPRPPGRLRDRHRQPRAPCNAGSMGQPLGFDGKAFVAPGMAGGQLGDTRVG